MFRGASLFNQDLCSWRDNFPYTNAYNMFTDSGCTYQDTPTQAQNGPFCASDCQSLQVVSCITSSLYCEMDDPFLFFWYFPLLFHLKSTTSATLPAAATTTSNPQQQEEDECVNTSNFLDLYGGSCEDYALPGNEAWCGAYGNDGPKVGNTPNENCCVCKGGLWILN